MRMILHVGMPKTGSSSIQRHLHGTDLGHGVSLARWSEPNHSTLVWLLFQDEERLGDYHGFSARGPAFMAKLPAMKQRWLASLEEDCAASRNGTLILSGEGMATHACDSALHRLRAFLRDRAREVRVIGYVRSPRSFAASHFQQLLKGGRISTLDVASLWPGYRERFARLDELFGRENVTLRPYDRDRLRDGDVVADFLHLAGLAPPAGKSPEANTSLSAEATALLYLQRSRGEGFPAGFLGALQRNADFISRLRTIGRRKFDFSGELWTPVLEANRADLDWMEERLGASLPDRADPRAIQIGSERDLTRTAMQSYAALEELVASSIVETDRLAAEDTACAVDLLRRLS
ncbi:hypothetical protein [Rhodobacter sp. CZR27]|uniref:hypothetical protein n=1 Tax=Rhodobacter sp. CZR27 TaxID=2033869 RepID=UPI000BBE2769|nr:hypothetical protein [Rhodobacter sp. CZR27]